MDDQAPVLLPEPLASAADALLLFPVTISSFLAPGTENEAASF